MCLGCRPVQALHVADQGSKAVQTLLILLPERAKQRVDGARLEIRRKAVEEHEAQDLVAMGIDEHPGVVDAQRVADDHERAGFPGRREERAKIERGVGQRADAKRIAGTPASAIVRARARRRRDLVVDARPGTGSVTHAGFEDDRRCALAAAVEKERSPIDLDKPALTRVWPSHAPKGEPGPWPTEARHVDGEGDGQSKGHDQRDPGHAPCGGSSVGVTGTSHGLYRTAMCRSIKTLRRPGETATTGELEAAARQYVRKVSGFREPSARNREAFETAIAEIAQVSFRLVESVGVAVEEGPDRWTPGSGHARSIT